ncbi:hypothetical protein PR048_006989 [Dryococelus australis]|uniref:Uncharacterized protein n=1 Tax=Dryococelus australis TaxID=614101 RepID=A0ABQ9ICG6_9NEOP|nr:hypothetical protein PR048_006989 [Dryococelus australis]
MDPQQVNSNGVLHCECGQGRLGREKHVVDGVARAGNLLTCMWTQPGPAARKGGSEPRQPLEHKRRPMARVTRAVRGEMRTDHPPAAPSSHHQPPHEGWKWGGATADPPCSSVCRHSSPLSARPALLLTPFQTVWNSTKCVGFLFGVNRAGRCRRSAGFFGYLPFPPLLHSDTAPYSSRLALIGSQDLDVKNPHKYLHYPLISFKEIGHSTTALVLLAQEFPEACQTEVGVPANDSSERGATRGCKDGGKWEMPEKTTPTSGFIQYDYHVRKNPRATPPGIELGSSWWKASSLIINTTAAPTVSLLASHQGDPRSILGRVTPDFGMWDSCRTMPLIGVVFTGISRFPRHFIPALLHTNLDHPHRLSRSRC